MRRSLHVRVVKTFDYIYECSTFIIYLQHSLSSWPAGEARAKWEWGKECSVARFFNFYFHLSCMSFWYIRHPYFPNPSLASGFFPPSPSLSRYLLLQIAVATIAPATRVMLAIQMVRTLIRRTVRRETRIIYVDSSSRCISN